MAQSSGPVYPDPGPGWNGYKSTGCAQNAGLIAVALSAQKLPGGKRRAPGDPDGDKNKTRKTQISKCKHIPLFLMGGAWVVQATMRRTILQLDAKHERDNFIYLSFRSKLQSTVTVAVISQPASAHTYTHTNTS